MAADEAQYTIDAINDYIDIRAGQKNNRLKLSGLMGHLADTSVDRMFNNAGSSVEDEAAYLGVNPDALRDAGNWANGVFTDPVTGFAYKYIFGYDGFAQWQRV